MQRYIVHLENNGFTVKNVKSLLNKARNVSISNSVIIDVRVASKHIEFDLLVEKDKIDQLLIILSKEIAPLRRCIEIVEKEINKDIIKHAIKLFNEERYWECHEVLEGLWRISKGYEKESIQGIILVAAAFVHLQKGEEDIAYLILKRAIPKLLININGINVINIKNIIEDMVKNRKINFFQIQVSE